MVDKKTSEDSAPKALKLTRGQLGLTLTALKATQESLQTALNSATNNTETAKFRISKLLDFPQFNGQ